MALYNVDFEIASQEKKVEHSESEKRLEMEMALQKSSFGHQYAMMELMNSNSVLEKVAAQEKLESSKSLYFQAREYLQQNFPERLKKIEEELLEQKNQFFEVYSA